MSPDKWQQIKSVVKKQFALEDEGRVDLLVDTADCTVKQGEAEYLVFESPLGRTKLELQTKPRLEEKKYFYSKREGDTARVEYKFSDKDLVCTFKAYKWDEVEDEWREIDPSRFHI